MENFIANREMWDELEYYRENGKILGKCEKVKSLSVRKGVENLSDIDIQKALNNARANLSKNKAKLEQAGEMCIRDSLQNVIRKIQPRTLKVALLIL